MPVRYGVSFDATFHMIMLHQCVNHIFQCAVVRIAEFNLNDLSQLILESFFAPCFHLPFCKGFLVAALVCVTMIEVIADGMDQTALHTLRSEEPAHFPQVSLIPAECSARFNMTVANQEMNVLVRCIYMNREQHLIALKESLSKRLCNPERLFVSQFVIILRRKGDRHFICKVCILDWLFPEQFSCHENITGEMVTVAVEAPVEVGFGFHHAVPYLLRLPAEQIVGGAAKLCR